MDSETGWIAGSLNDQQYVLRTTDRGRSWAAAAIASKDTIRRVHFADRRLGAAVTERGEIWLSKDGGAQWRRIQQPGGGAVWFSDAKNAWMVGLDGSIRRTADGGENWLTQVAPAFPDFRVARWVLEQRALAFGGYGGVWRTDDGGSTWLRQELDFSRQPVRMTDGGATDWRDSWSFTTYGTSGITEVGPVRRLYSFFLNERDGWKVGRYGSIEVTQDEGKNWKTQRGVDTSDLFAVTFPDALHGWIAGDKGLVQTTTDGGTIWTRQQTPVTQPLLDIHFLNLKRGFAVGGRGTILSTTDGGNNWTKVYSPSDEDLRSIDFSKTGQGLIAGANGTMLRSTDDGRTWTPPVKYKQYPPPWYFAVMLIVAAGMITLVVERREALPSFIAEQPMSDAPVATIEGDRLGARTLVEQLFHFIANRNTMPPLSISIEGPWGSGKSSIMRMLCSQLEAKRAARVVWFNAWHHQKEDPLLAYLMQAIHEQAVPSWFSLHGLRFRFRLLMARLAGNLLQSTALFAAVACAYYFSPQGLSADSILSGKIRMLDPRLAPVAGLLAAAAYFYTNYLRVFGSSPADLLKTAKEGFQLTNLVGKTDVRLTFQRELDEVTEALAPQRLVIFLDDLDRCSPPQVVALLECINYLSSSSGCFLITGMDWEKVLTAVGLQLGDAAVEESKRKGTFAKEKEPHIRAAYARDYLRKILNFSVAVPQPAHRHRRKFLTDPVFVSKKEDILKNLRNFALVVSFAAVLAGMYLLPTPKGAPPEERPTATATAPATGTPQTPPPGPAQQPRPQLRRGDMGADTLPVTKKPTDTHLLVYFFLSSGLVAVLAAIFGRSQTAQSQDSIAFRQALASFSELLSRKHPTPRDMKRFLNYLRLLASAVRSRRPPNSVESTAVFSLLYRYLNRSAAVRSALLPVPSAPALVWAVVTVVWRNRLRLTRSRKLIRHLWPRYRAVAETNEAQLVFMASTGQQPVWDGDAANPSIELYEQHKLPVPTRDEWVRFERLCRELGIDMEIFRKSREAS